MPKPTKKCMETLVQYSIDIANCSKNKLNSLVEEKINLLTPAEHEETSDVSLIGLRWMCFTLKSLEVAEEKKSRKAFAYSTVLNHRLDLIENYEKKYEKESKNIGLLKKLIQQQKEFIFNQCVAEVARAHLSQYRQYKSFSVENTIKEALDVYLEKMYYEELNQFETICLLDRQDDLEDKKLYEQRSLVSGFLTLNTEILPELKFIRIRLIDDDLYEFKLHGTKGLLPALGDLKKLSPEIIEQNLEDYFREYGEDSIDTDISNPELAENAGNNIVSENRSITLYLNNDHIEYTTCKQHMLRACTELNSIIDTIRAQEKSIMLEHLNNRAFSYTPYEQYMLKQCTGFDAFINQVTLIKKCKILQLIEDKKPIGDHVRPLILRANIDDFGVPEESNMVAQNDRVPKVAFEMKSSESGSPKEPTIDALSTLEESSMVEHLNNQALGDTLNKSALISQAEPSIVLPKMSNEQEIPEDLIKVRALVSQYQDALDVIEQNERTIYKDRCDQLLQKRRKALNELATCLERADQLTPGVREEAKEYIMEIKKNAPSWNELSWLDMILDILTLGLHALYRHTIFKQQQEEVDLYDAEELQENEAVYS